MFGQIVSAKIAALLVAGAVASGGAVASAVVSLPDGHASDTAKERVTDNAGAGNAESRRGERNEAELEVDVVTESRGQGEEISELATTLEGGPEKGAEISAAAKGHGQEVSAEVRQNPSGAEKPERP